MSKTDVRVGTSMELNGKTYQTIGEFSSIKSVVIGSNFIRGNMELLMQRVLFLPDDIPDLAKVYGGFTAVSE